MGHRRGGGVRLADDTGLFDNPVVTQLTTRIVIQIIAQNIVYCGDVQHVSFLVNLWY